MGTSPEAESLGSVLILLAGKQTGSYMLAHAIMALLRRPQRKMALMMQPMGTSPEAESQADLTMYGSTWLRTDWSMAAFKLIS